MKVLMNNLIAMWYTCSNVLRYMYMLVCYKIYMYVKHKRGYLNNYNYFSSSIGSIIMLKLLLL